MGGWRGARIRGLGDGEKGAAGDVGDIGNMIGQEGGCWQGGGHHADVKPG